MTGSTLLDVLIGLTLLYLVLSIGCSGLLEWLSALLGLRANNLEAAVRSLLLNSRDTDGKPLVGRFYDHPLIQTLMRQPNKDLGAWLKWLASAPLPSWVFPFRALSADSSGGKPSFIPSSLFVTTMLEILKPPNWQSNEPVTANDFWQIVNALPEDKAGGLKQVLRPLAGASPTSLADIRKSLESWFDNAMERASGWYKRKTWFITFALAVLLCAVLNIDSLAIARSMAKDPAARSLAVAEGQKQLAAPPQTSKEAPSPAGVIITLGDTLAALQLPIGWTTTPAGDEWIPKIAGLLATAVAAALGSPIWFAALNRLINLRATGSLTPVVRQQSPG